MMAAMQKLATQLEQRVAAEQLVAECDAQLQALHEEANAVYNKYKRNKKTTRHEKDSSP